MVDLVAEVQRVHDICDSVGRVGGDVPEVVHRDTLVVDLFQVDSVVDDSSLDVLPSVKSFSVHDLVGFVDRDNVGCHS